jgi:hypothetical protein
MLHRTRRMQAGSVDMAHHAAFRATNRHARKTLGDNLAKSRQMF